MLNEDILLSILKNNFDKVITIIDEERPCYVETIDVLTITKDEIKNSDNGRFVVNSINLKESDEYILEFGGRIMKGEQTTRQIGNNTVRYIEFYDDYVGYIFVDDTSIPIEGTEEYAYNETTAVVSIGELYLPFEKITDIKLKKLNIKPLSNDLLEKDLVIQNSISLGRVKNSNIGRHSYAVGEEVTASSHASHAEGYNTTANGDDSHAEGNGTNASGHHSHAEGNTTTASGYASHAEGEGTIASGTDSHAEGAKTIANGNYQHVQGKFNIEDNENKYAHIVGNGDSTARSNGHTLDWDGNAWFKGNVSIDGTPTNDNELVTKKYVDDNTQLCWLEDYEATGDRLQYADVNVSSLTSRVFYAFNFKKHPGVTTVRLLKSYDDGTIKSIINLGSTLEYMYLMNISSSIMTFYLKYATGIIHKCVCRFGNTSDECNFERTPMVLLATNTYEYTPTTDYNPATKKYVDDKFIALDSMETVGTIPQSELQKCNNGTSRYVSSIDFDTLFSEPNNYMYYATYKDDTLIPIDYQSNLNRMVTRELDSADGEGIYIGFDYGTHMMYPFNGGMASIKAYTFTNDLIIKRCPLINANVIATKEYVDKHVGNRIITVNNVNDSLTLTTDKNQYATLAVPVEIILPTVTSFTELHLFFSGSEGVTIGTTDVKWESQVTIENNKSYEIIFTYVNESIGWLGKTIVYS